MEKKKMRNKILIVTLCVAAVILVAAGIVAGPGRMLMEKYQEAKIKKAHEAQVKKNRAKLRDDEYVQAQIMDYLEERYHEKFVMKSYGEYLANWYGNYVSMEVWPEGKEDDEHLFIVEGDVTDEGNLEYSDSYVYVLIEKEFLEYFEPVINEYFDDFYCEVDFFPTMGTASNKIPGNVTVEEFLEFQTGKDYARPVLKVYSEKKLEPEKERFFYRDLRSRKFRGRVDLNTTNNNGDVLEHDEYHIK